MHSQAMVSASNIPQHIFSGNIQQTARLYATSVRLKQLKLTSFCLISCARAPLAFSYLQILKFNCHGYFGFYLYTENVLYSEKAWTCIQNDITQQRRSADGYVTTSWPGRSCVIPFWTHAKCPLFFITYLPTWLHAMHTICKIVGSTLSYAMQCYVFERKPCGFFWQLNQDTPLSILTFDSRIIYGKSVVKEILEHEPCLRPISNDYTIGIYIGKLSQIFILPIHLAHYLYITIAY